jgi:uncharacterized protein YjiS (DUF1127 family)
MARLTQDELDLIAAARARGPHPDAPATRPAETPLPEAPRVRDLSPAQLRAVAEAERARVIATGTGAALRWLGARLSAATRGLRRARLENRTRSELSVLSDVMLRDIGMTRSEIPARAREHAEMAIPRPQPKQRTGHGLLIWPFLRLN